MNTGNINPKVYDLAGKVIGLAMKVHTKLGSGFLESVYHQSLLIELHKAGLKYESEKRADVYYDQTCVGYFDADIVVESNLIIEVKSIEILSKTHEIQLVNYLVATKINEGLLLNFGSKSLNIKRSFVFQNLPKQIFVNFENFVILSKNKKRRSV